jgi:protein O-mannosyl-transferase
MDRRSISLIFALLLVLCTAGLYWPARNFRFINWDDTNEVLENPLLHPPSAQSLRQFWTGPYLNLYAPLSYTVWWTMSSSPQMADNPYWFHLLNVGLHIGCSLLVFWIALLCVKAPVAAFGGAAIFALHPMQVESVAWVAEMNNLLAGMLSLGAIGLYVCYAKSNAKQRWLLYGLASACYLLALFAKPTAVIVPLIAGILENGFLRRPWRRMLFSLLPWLMVAGIFGWIAHQAQSGFTTTPAYRPIAAVDALALYWQKLFCPIGLTIDYGRMPRSVAANHGWILSGVALVALATVLWTLRRTYRGLDAGVLVMVAGLVPVLGLVPFAFQDFSTVADHFMYLPMLGVALAVAALLTEIRWQRALGIVAILGLAMTWLGAGQLQIWRDSDALAAHALAIDPGSALGNMIAGTMADRRHLPEEAIPHFAAAIARIPNEPDFHFNLAQALRETGQFEKAVEEYQRTIDLSRSPNLNAMNNLGVTYAQLGRIALARVMFSEVLQIDPQNANATQNLRMLGGQ